MRRNTFGLGFIKPKIVVVIAIIKLFIGYCQLQTETYNLIKFNIEVIILEIGILKFPYQMDSKYQYWTPTLINYITNILYEREIDFSEITTIWSS